MSERRDEMTIDVVLNSPPVLLNDNITTSNNNIITEYNYNKN